MHRQRAGASCPCLNSQSSSLTSESAEPGVSAGVRALLCGLRTPQSRQHLPVLPKAVRPAEGALLDAQLEQLGPSVLHSAGRLSAWPALCRRQDRVGGRCASTVGPPSPSGPMQLCWWVPVPFGFVRCPRWNRENNGSFGLQLKQQQQQQQQLWPYLLAGQPQACRPGSVSEAYR